MTSKKMWKQWKEITENHQNNSHDESFVSQCKSSSSSHFNKITFTKKNIDQSKQKSQKSLRFSTLQKARKFSQINGLLGLNQKKQINQKLQKNNKQVDNSSQQPYNTLKRVKSKNWVKVNKCLNQAKKQHLLLKKVVKNIIDQFQTLKSQIQNNMKSFVKQVISMCQDVENLQNLKQQLNRVQISLNQASMSKIKKMPSFQSSHTNDFNIESRSKIGINSIIKEPNTPMLELYDRSQSPKRHQTTGQRQNQSAISSPKLNGFLPHNNSKKNVGSMILIDNNQKRPTTQRKHHERNATDSFDKQLSRHKDGSIYMDEETVKPLYNIVNQMRNILNEVDIDEII